MLKIKEEIVFDNVFYLIAKTQVEDQMKLLQDSWSDLLVLDHIHQRLQHGLQDETSLPNGQKFNLVSLALLGVPTNHTALMAFQAKLAEIKFDTVDYLCLKFLLLLNPGRFIFEFLQTFKVLPKKTYKAQTYSLSVVDVRGISDRNPVANGYQATQQALVQYCMQCYPQIPVSLHFTFTNLLHNLITFKK